MYNQQKLERYFQLFFTHLKEHLPDGLLEITPAEAESLLHSPDSFLTEPLLTRYFQFHELPDKMVLANHQFIIWIVPNNSTDQFTVLIAQNREPQPRLELGFVAKDLPDPSITLLKIIEKFLSEIHENEKSIQKYELGS